MTPRLFCEFPAGLASVSLRLHGGEYCRPPISRMGNKAGYAAVILAALGLRSGSGAGAYWWAEADDDVRALLRCYPDAAMLRRVAEIIRGWADEEPRALWERLRAERKARGPREDAEGTAGWLTSSWMSYGQDPARGFRATAGGGWPDDPPDPESVSASCYRLAEYAMIAASNRLINIAGPDLTNTGAGGTTFGGEEFATPAREVGERFEGMAREVAGWVQASAWAYKQCMIDSGYCGPGERRQDTTATATATARLASGGWPPVRVTRAIPTADEVAAALGTPGDLEGVVVYMDPPYLGTTGYLHDLGRDEVVRIAYEFDRLGAVVAISEAEVVIPEWHAVEITAGRKGQKRTFSKQQQEWITMNREPAHRVAVQSSMFALGGVS